VNNPNPAKKYFFDGLSEHARAVYGARTREKMHPEHEKALSGARKGPCEYSGTV